MTARAVDFQRPQRPEGQALLARRIAAEALAASPSASVVLRPGARWEACFRRRPGSGASAMPLLRSGGRYLVLGGASAIGALVAEALAEAGAGELLLTGSGDLAGLESEPGRVSKAVLSIARVSPLADGDLAALAACLDASAPLDGIIDVTAFHEEKPVGLLQSLTQESCERAWQRQRQRLELLRSAADSLAVDFCMVMSSLAAHLGAPGQAMVAALGLQLQALAEHENASGAVPWYVVCWDQWSADAHDARRITPARGAALLRELFYQQQPANLVIAMQAPTPGGAPRTAIPSVLPGGQPEVRPERTSAHRRPELDTAYRAPASALERQLAESWERCLGIGSIGRDDDFFTLGGNSLLGAQLLAAINSLCAVTLDLNSLFSAPTIAGLASLVLEQQIAKHGATELEAELARIESLSAEALAELLAADDAAG